MYCLAYSDLLGFAAAGPTLLTFWQRSMPMRLCAIGANVCFIAYAALVSLPPVMALHVVLLPLNIKRLLDMHAHAALSKALARALHLQRNSSEDGT